MSSMAEGGGDPFEVAVERARRELGELDEAALAVWGEVEREGVAPDLVLGRVLAAVGKMLVEADEVTATRVVAVAVQAIVAVMGEGAAPALHEGGDEQRGREAAERQAASAVGEREGAEEAAEPAAEVGGVVHAGATDEDQRGA